MSRVLTAAAVLAIACGRTEVYRPAPPATPVARLCPTAGVIRVTADDAYVLYLNGLLIDDVPRLWSDPQRYDVTLWGGSNLLAVKATNLYNTGGLDRGLVLELMWGRGSAVTDASWKLSTPPDGGWVNADFDDSGWSFATVLGPEGIAPWGDLLPGSKASWIWSYVPDGPGDAKPVVEPLAFRKTVWNDTACP